MPTPLTADVKGPTGLVDDGFATFRKHRAGHDQRTGNGQK